jgi:hypothetical protein
MPARNFPENVMLFHSFAGSYYKRMTPLNQYFSRMGVTEEIQGACGESVGAGLEYHHKVSALCSGQGDLVAQ